MATVLFVEKLFKIEVENHIKIGDIIEINLSLT